MWKLGFLLTAWLVHAAVSSDESSFLNAQRPSDLDAEFDRIAEDYLSTLSLAHSKAPSRKKREVFDTTLLLDKEGVYRLKGLYPVSRLCNPAVYSTFLTVMNVTYAVCAKSGTENEAAEVIFGIYRDHQWDVMHRWYVGIPTGLAAFAYNEFIYVLVADTERVDGTDLVRINIYTGEREMEYTVNSKSATSISIWKMKKDDNYHMAIANSAGIKDDFNSEVYIYEWKGTYFDRYSSFPAYDVKDLQPFHIYGTAYLAVANFRRGRNNQPVDSEILKYSLDKNRWVSHQKIRTYGATDWEFFSLGSNTSQEFFLMVANRDAEKMNPVIYKFVKDQFVPFQCLPVDGATSAAAWSSGTHFLLAVASFDAVYLFQYDGWEFVLSKTQYTQNSLGYGKWKHLVFNLVQRNSADVLILSKD